MEFTALRTNQRRYSAGANVYGTTGEHWDGDEDDFAGLAPRSKYWLLGEAPASPCEVVRRSLSRFVIGTPGLVLAAHMKSVVGFLIGSRLIDPVSRIGISLAGFTKHADSLTTAISALKFAGFVAHAEGVSVGAFQLGGSTREEDEVSKSVGAFQLGGVGVDLVDFDGGIILTSGARVGGAFQLGGSTREEDEVSKSVGAFQLGGSTLAPVEEVVAGESLAGFLLGGMGVDLVDFVGGGILPIAGARSVGAFQIAGLVDGSSAAVVGNSVGAFQIAGLVDGSSAAVIGSSVGAFQLGGITVAAPPAGPPAPGGSCAAASALTLGVTYPFVLSGPGPLWWYIDLPSTGVRTLSLINFGPGLLWDLRFGSCAALNFVFGCDAGSPGGSFFCPGPSRLYVKADGPPGVYNIQFTLS